MFDLPSFVFGFGISIMVVSALCYLLNYDIVKKEVKRNGV